MEHIADPDAKLETLNWKLAAMVGRMDKSKAEMRTMFKQEVEAVQSSNEIRIRKLELEVQDLRRKLLPDATSNGQVGRIDANDLRKVAEVEGHGHALGEQVTPSTDATAPTMASIASLPRASYQSVKLSLAGSNAGDLIKEALLVHKSAQSFHQATIFYCLKPWGVPVWKKLLFITLSFLIVFMQVFAVCSMIASSAEPSCKSEMHCAEQQYCSPTYGRCQYCGEVFTLSDGNYLYTSENGISQNITGHNGDRHPCVETDAICNACYDAVTGIFFTLDSSKVAYNSVYKMRSGDWLALVLTSCILALTATVEVRDVQVCHDITRSETVHKFWFYAVWSLNFFRRHCVVPSFVSCMPLVLVHQGSDCLNIFFNVLAIVFILHLDNEIFKLALPLQTREEVQEHWRVELDGNVLRKISMTKTTYVVLVGIGFPVMFLNVLFMEGDTDYLFYFIWLVPVVDSIQDAIMCNKSLKARLYASCFAVAKCVLAMAIFIFAIATAHEN